jgi:exopolyphosphatase/guanosine-5'-triphosphate,3'-diphosphate pyrophosphatase
MPHALIVDVGGGSTELIWMKDRQLQECISLPFGTINLSQRFALGEKITAAQEKALHGFIAQQLKQIPWLKEKDRAPLICIGGSLRNMGKMDRIYKNYPLDIAHNYEMSSADLGRIYDFLKNKSLAEKKKIKGLSKDRADTIVSAAAIVTALSQKCQMRQVFISGNGLREGILYSYLHRQGQRHDNPLDLSLQNNLDYYHLNRQHASNVYRLTSLLYKQLRSLHGMHDENAKILKTAALLHDSGITIRYYKHNRHSFYMIIHSVINGLSHREIVMSAYVAAAHYADGY